MTLLEAKDKAAQDYGHDNWADADYQNEFVTTAEMDNIFDRAMTRFGYGRLRSCKSRKKSLYLCKLKN